jgi:hypothetical protein
MPARLSRHVTITVAGLTGSQVQPNGEPVMQGVAGDSAEDPDERKAGELSARYGAGAITLDELVGALKNIAIESLPRTAAEILELRELLDKMDWEPLVSRLRNLGP